MKRNGLSNETRSWYTMKALAIYVDESNKGVGFFTEEVSNQKGRKGYDVS